VLSSLAQIGQGHLLSTWDQLSGEQQAHLRGQLALCTPALLEQQRTIRPQIPAALEPWRDVKSSGYQEFGRRAVMEGRVGCLLLAGGQGSRLRCPSAKGLVTLEGKTLFQLFAETVPPEGRLAIMLCAEHFEEVTHFFELHGRFGLREDQLSFFVQGELPLLDLQGNWFLERADRLAVGPDGNGGALHHFYKSGIWSLWKSQGVDLVRVLPIDNLLAAPFDTGLLGRHIESGHEVSLEAVARHDPHERVGLLVRQESRPLVVEYSEVSPLTASQVPWANLSQFCMNMEFIERVALGSPLPLHAARKAAKTMDGWPQEPNCIKCERFIFDALERARSVGVVAADRSQFVPLKSPADIDPVIKALRRRGRIG
jgi:UDP-N-acetylglucosamine/UDP-N-acetylgalactosamine diphosphorylase